MVKKASFFTRLRERWRSGSGVRVDERAGNGGKAEPVRSSVRRMEGNGGSHVPGPVHGELKTTRKLNEREEAMVALGEHFQELATLLRGSHSRMDAQTQKLVDAADSLRQLPALGNRQLDLLQNLAGQLERQNTLGEQVARTMGALPTLLQNVETALQRAAATDERTSNTMREFQANMDRIQMAMGRMVASSEQQAASTKALAEQREESLRTIATGLEKAQQDGVQELRTAAEESMQTLRRAHEDQSNRLHKVVQEHAGWNKAVLGVLGVVLIVLVGMLVMQLVK